MQGLEAREAVLECAARDGDIAEGALWIAADDCPGVEPEPWLERIDELAGELRTRCGLRECGPADAPLVGALLRDRLRLRGAGGGDPRAHYLHHVLERGAGVPIACSAIWIAVGVRAHIPVEGVNLPGHFVVRVDGHMFDTGARWMVSSLRIWRAQAPGTCWRVCRATCAGATRASSAGTRRCALPIAASTCCRPHRRSGAIAVCSCGGWGGSSPRWWISTRASMRHPRPVPTAPR